MGTAARRALELDDGLAEVHTVLGMYLGVHSWDWEGAERAFRRAIELDPEHARARHFYGYLLEALGRSRRRTRNGRRPSRWSRWPRS